MHTPKSLEVLDCSHQRARDNCIHCGVYMHSHFEAYKSHLYECDQEASSRRHLRCLRNNVSRFHIAKERFSYSEVIFNFLEKICAKFEFSIETLALGIYLFNDLLQRNSGNRNQLVDEMEFYSSVCLMVAAKAIELDKNIPYFSRYQRYAEKTHTKEQYEKAEMELMDEFEFNLQIPTFATFVSYYLSNGILFQNDYYSKSRVFVLEERVQELMYKHIKSGSFVNQDQEKLASRMILLARKECKLKWNPIIEEYSLLPLAHFEETQILKQIQIHHSFTALPSLGKTSRIFDRTVKKSCSSSKRDLSSKAKHKPLQRKASLSSVPMLSVLHYRSHSRME